MRAFIAALLLMTAQADPQSIKSGSYYNFAVIGDVTHGAEMELYVLDTDKPHNCEYWERGTNFVFSTAIVTNTVQSRLVDLPNLLCTITNRVLVVQTKTVTNVIVLERIGVGCVEQPVPPLPAVRNWDGTITVPVDTNIHPW